MTRSFVTLTAAFSAAALWISPLGGDKVALAGPHWPDPCTKSTLCSGLQDVFLFEEPSDWPRFGAFGGLLNEKLGANVAADTLSQFQGAASLQLGSDYLFSGFTPGPSGYFTIAVWAGIGSSAGANGTKKSLLSWDNQTRRGTDIYLESNGTNLRACISVFAAENDTQSTSCTGYTIATSTWNLIVAGGSDHHLGQGRIFVSVNGGSKTTTSIAYYLRTGRPYLRIGQRPWSGFNAAGDQQFDGKLDHLAFWARELEPADITLLHNGGSGRSYPYDTADFSS